METFEQRLEQQRREAAERMDRRSEERHQHRSALESPGGIAVADTPEHVMARLKRLRDNYPDQAVGSLAEVALSAESGGRFTRFDVPGTAATATTEVVLERIINTEDFVDIRYLEAGVASSRAVGRVNIRDALRLQGYGSASLVSPLLLLTNHHVLPSAEIARTSVIEFDYQDGIDGRPLQPQVFALDPATFFVADENLDFALVAVRAAEGALAQFGFNRLIEAQGKAIIGEFVTIVQHPRGEKKQVALRENRIVDLEADFMHYEADTEPGSSGSPVFNDQWEVVALHHASVPSAAVADGGGFVNEGIRISRILGLLRERELEPERRRLVDQLFAPEVVRLVPPATPPGNGHASLVQPQSAAVPQAAAIAPAGGEVTLSIPLEVTVRVGAAAAPAAPERIEIDPDYTKRRGYDPRFLGTPIALPVAPASPVLPYHHFSVCLNTERRLAQFTAVNIDGNLSAKIRRERDKWILDPRVPAEQQTGENVYASNPLDRGHLVRRLDPAWGATPAEAKLANDDTFHFTNCTPQHEDFNQNKTTWAGLEDYILESADNRDLKVTVFTGPVLASDDDEYRGVQLPRQFWKVAAMVKSDGALSATGYLLSQAELIAGLERLEEFSYAAYRTYQVRIRQIEALTGLSFGTLASSDPLERLEADVAGREVGGPEDLIL